MQRFVVQILHFIQDEFERRAMIDIVFTDQILEYLGEKGDALENR
jgi:hypothetical protein